MADQANTDNGLVIEENYESRVKLFQMNDKCHWLDLGTGFVSASRLQGGAAYLVVMSEDGDGTASATEKLLLAQQIRPEDIYQRQNATLIVWAMPELNTDLALSFASPAGCDALWRKICNFQQLPTEDGLSYFDGDSDGFGAATVELLSEPSMGPLILPQPEMGSLGALAEALTAATQTAHMGLGLTLVQEQYVPRLLDVFQAAEDLEALDALHSLFKVFAAMFLLNDQNLIEELLLPKHIVRVIGALEYDPEVPHAHHRKFLETTACFKQVIPFSEASLVQMIHQTYRIAYIKDVVLPRLLDDNAFTMLNAIIFLNNVSIVTQIHKDRSFLVRLFAELAAPATKDAHLRDLMLLLQEFTSLSKNLHLPERTVIYTSLAGLGLMHIFLRTISAPDGILRMAATDVLACVVTHEPGLVVKHLVGEAPQYPLFHAIVRQLANDRDHGVQTQLTEVMRVLLDPETLKEIGVHEQFLDIFYRDMVEVLCGPFLAPAPQTEGKDEALGIIKNNLLDLICFCLHHHGYRIRYFVIGTHLAENIMQLALHRETYLALAAVRFLRALLGVREEVYRQYVVDNDLLRTVVARIKANGPRDNLFTAAVAELTAFLCAEESASLTVLDHVVTRYGAVLESTPFAFVFEPLRRTRNALLAKRDERPGGSRKRRGGGGLTASEEAYFQGVGSSDDEVHPAEAAEATAAGVFAGAPLLQRFRDDSGPPVKRRRLSGDEGPAAEGLAIGANRRAGTGGGITISIKSAGGPVRM